MLGKSDDLIPHGILNEESDYRIHICYLEGYAYLYPTQNGKELARSNKYPLAGAKQSGYDGYTAMGRLVPPMDIPECQRIKIPQDLLDIYLPFHRLFGLSDMGSRAVEIVHRMLLRGMISFSVIGHTVEEKDIQIKGVDITVSFNTRIQVKCDQKGSMEKQIVCFGGIEKEVTGNLYLQTEERNPFHRH